MEALEKIFTIAGSHLATEQEHTDNETMLRIFAGDCYRDDLLEAEVS